MYLSLARAKYNRYKVYIHNLANFDGIFLLRVLVKLGNVNVLMNNGKLISIELKFTPIDSNYSIVLDFRDSYQILLSSLSKLGKSFKVAAVGMLAACLRKTIFPYNFVNKNNLNYIGKTPDIKYFDNISIEKYNEYKVPVCLRR